MSDSKIIVEKNTSDTRIGDDAEARLGRITAELYKAGILFHVEDQTNIYIVRLKGY